MKVIDIKSIIITENIIIGDEHPCLIIAEAGINHNGDVSIAKSMIDAAKECGADAVKFQTFKAEEFISDPEQTYTYYSQGKEVTESMMDMFKRYEFSGEEWIEIADYCKKVGIIFFSTPQNKSDLDFLLKIVDIPVIKVGSDDLTNLELLKYCASKRLPIIISAGMAYLSEIEDAVNTIRNTGNDNLAVLHCVSSYPAGPDEINLRKMLTIRLAFDLPVGFSDHTIGTNAAVAAAALGAKVIEKHFTLDKNLAGPDQWFSSDPGEFKELVNGIRFAEKALGSYEIKPTLKEMGMRKIARRSIVASRDIIKGETIGIESITLKRPGIGLPPKFLDFIIGKEAKTDIKKGDLIDFEKV